MTLLNQPKRIRAGQGVIPRHEPAAAALPSVAEVLQTAGLILSLVATLAAVFGLSCLAYAHLAASCQRAAQGPLGELWGGILP